MPVENHCQQIKIENIHTQFSNAFQKSVQSLTFPN